MDNNKTTRLPWMLCAVVIVGAIFSFALTVDDARIRADVFEFVKEVLNALYSIAYGVVGALILSRLARNRIGWLLMVIGLSIAVLGSLSSFLAQTASDAELTAAKILVIWLSGWSWWLLIGPLLLILLVFPTGQLLSARWRWVVRMIALLFVTFIGLATLSPEWQDPATGKVIPNPLGIDWIPPGFTFETIQGPWFIALVSTVALCVLSVLVRYRRSGAIEREQLKWFLYACVFFIVVYAAVGFLTIGVEPPSWMGIFISLALVLLPVSIGIAILRYRLFDIDIIIRRTVIYGALTATLVLFYFGAVIVLQQLFRAMTGAGDDLAIIISTLAIAALFNPLRHRVQDAIDHRFYRRKYDAQKVLERFATTVRDEVELEKLTGELLKVVNETMRPASVSLWLRKIDK